MAIQSDITDFAVPAAPATEVSLFRLYLLRAGYLLLVVGLGSMIWPVVFHHRHWPDVMHGAAVALLAAIALLAVIGLRYPLKMLPLLLFEMAWKAIWLIAIGYPLWAAGAMDADTTETARNCLMGAIFLLIIPWRYVFTHYIAAPGDRWRS